MPPDLYFALTLIVKMAITAAFVLAATITAERAGPLGRDCRRQHKSGGDGHFDDEREGKIQVERHLGRRT